jgi:antitoxin ParD1/3/4
MTISLTPAQLRWLEAGVAAGHFASVEDGVRLGIAALKDAADAADNDLAWAKPLVDDAMGDIERGEGIPADSVRAEMDRYLKATGVR